MKKGRPKGTTGKARVLSKKEMEKAIITVKCQHINGRYRDRDAALLATSYYLGLRAKELAGLKIRDIIGSNGEVAQAINLKITKGDKARTVYLPNVLRDTLGSFLSSIIYNKNIDGPLFKSQKGSCFSPNTLQSLLKRIYTKCSLDNCSSHTGRRSFATRLIEEGADIKAVSSLMGHSSITMTAKYVDDNPKRLSRIVNNLL